MNDIIFQCIGAYVGCLGFAFIFRIHNNMKLAIFGAFNGLMTTIFYNVFAFTGNVYLQSFAGMFIGALLAEYFARKFKAPTTIFITIGCFPLVPGRGIYMTMLYAVNGMHDLFIDSFIETVGIAIAIALAILVASTIILINKQIKTHPDVFFKEPFE